MRIVYGHQSLEQPPPDVVMTVGTFDGVHRGHQAVISEVVRRARAIGGTALVYSFYPPPWRVLGRTENPFLITTFLDKATLMAALGVDVLVTETFSSDFQNLDAKTFVDDVIIGSFAPKEVLVGYDFRFGRKRQGSLPCMAERLARTGGTAEQLGAEHLDDAAISSSRVRRAVVDGDMHEAARLLGRWHFLSGAVVRGQGRGAGIGFPTANLSPRTELIPGPGVYAVMLQTRLGIFPGVANLGFRPTFAEHGFSIEAFLFDFDGDLYGEEVKLHTIHRVRGERRFESKDALVEQIAKDAEQVRAMLPFPDPHLA
jgi:riboflavin kinase / FMN adenylyltransferase